LQRAEKYASSKLGNLAQFASLYRVYRRRKIRRLVSAYPRRVVTHSYHGYELSLSVEDPLAEGWYDHDWPSLPELNLLAASRLKPGARVFDLGAHQGVVAMVLARLVGEEGVVVAVEAERHNHGVALRNLALNHVTNVTLIHAAVAADEGSLRFAEGLNGHVLCHGGLGSAGVAAMTIDGLADRYGWPDVVFLDVEGYEVEALRGAVRCIAGGKTDFFVETHIGHGLEEAGGTVADVLGHFPDVRFRRLVSPAGDQLDSYEFTELDVAAMPPEERFFFVALAYGARQRDAAASRPKRGLVNSPRSIRPSGTQ
jgi:FkbM family methyltransferase